MVNPEGMGELPVFCVRMVPRLLIKEADKVFAPILSVLFALPINMLDALMAALAVCVPLVLSNESTR